MFLQTLDATLVDWVVDTEGLGYLANTVILGGVLALSALAYYKSKISEAFTLKM